MTAKHNTNTSLASTGLLLIGMGPGRLSGMSLEAIEAAKSSDVRRYEAYTALWPQAELDALEDAVGSIEKVMRPEVEQPDVLFELARTSLVALLVVGDPLQATTHVDLQLQAAEAGIECHVFHGVSITTLVTGAIGLSNYKFGRQTTLTYPYGGWVATSPLEVIAANMHQNLHMVEYKTRERWKPHSFLNVTNRAILQSTPTIFHQGSLVPHFKETPDH